jgi:outer membrane protein X
MRIAQVFINTLIYNKMKKKFFSRVAIAAIAMFTISMTAVAQEQGDMAVGGNLVLGTGESYTNIGIGAKFQYNVLEPLRLEGSFTYFLEKDYLSMWDLSVNSHWLLPVADNIKVYPLAGLGIMSFNVNGFDSTTKFAISLGGGVDFNLTEAIFLNAEAKYKIIEDYNRLLLSVGIGYRF